jgi:hypothetical protein
VADTASSVDETPMDTKKSAPAANDTALKPERVTLVVDGLYCSSPGGDSKMANLSIVPSSPKIDRCVLVRSSVLHLKNCSIKGAANCLVVGFVLLCFPFCFSAF